MELKQIDIIRSPINPDRVRLVGEVYYDNKTFSPELYWLEVDKEYEEYLSTTGNPWLVCLLPLAVTLNEPLYIPLDIDSKLYKNAHELMKIWTSWYSNLHIIRINAKINNNQIFSKSADTASFFTGGVDSFFTLLQHEKNSETETKINIKDLLLILGFDIPLKNSVAFNKKKSSLQNVATAFNKCLIDVATNIRETRWGTAAWGNLSHGSGLGFAALALEKKYSTILIPSTSGYKNLMPWGSHPLTDPLLSTGTTNIIHDGAHFNRLDKTEFIAQHKIVLDFLHVCWVLKNNENCCKCEKCYRTMIMLDLLGVLSQCKTFSINNYRVKNISKILLRESYHMVYADQILRRARDKHRKDIVRAINKSLVRSKYINKFLLTEYDFEFMRHIHK